MDSSLTPPPSAALWEYLLKLSSSVSVSLLLPPSSTPSLPSLHTESTSLHGLSAPVSWDFSLSRSVEIKIYNCTCVIERAREGEDQYTMREGEDQYTMREGEDQYTMSVGEDQYTTREGEDQYTMRDGEDQYTMRGGRR